jgi:hypothetical protein
MSDLVTDKFTLGVFQDVPSAEKGIDALVRHHFAVTSLSIIAKDSPEVQGLVSRVFGVTPAAVEVKNLGPTVLHGPLIGTLNGDAKVLLTQGIAAAARRAGFQPHDGVIYERLTDRGGVLVGVSSEARSSDALSTLHAFGGGNAAIGAWAGRV